MGARASIGRRIQALPPGRADALVALGFLVAGAVPVLVGAPARQALPALALIVAQAVGLALRRRSPLLGWVLGFTPASAGNVFLGAPVNDLVIAPFVGVFLASFSVGAHLEGRRRWWVVAAVGVAATAVQAAFDRSGDTVVSDVVWGALAMLVVPLLVGRLVRRRAQLNSTLRERATAAARERDRAAEAAVAAERERVAADLHDVVAHALSAMVVQAEVARRDARETPDRARAAFAAVEGTGREALTEIRRMLGVLRRDDEELAFAPQPSLEHIRSLLRRSARTGLAVELHVDGTPRILPAGVDLTGYRLIQTALERAREDGGAETARVALRYEQDAIALEVVDDGAGGARDLGGLHERVSLYGGDLRAAPRIGGGHGLLARLPAGASA